MTRPDRMTCAYCGETKPLRAFPARWYAKCDECMRKYEHDRQWRRKATWWTRVGLAFMFGLIVGVNL